MLTLSKNNRITRWPWHERSVGGIAGNNGHRVGKAEVRELASAPRKSSSPFNIDKQTRCSDEGTDEPHE